MQPSIPPRWRISTLFLLALAVPALVLSGLAACRSTSTPTRADLLQDGLDRLAAAVRYGVADPVAKEVALTVLDELRNTELEFLESVKGSRATMRELNLRYDATREDFVRELEELQTIRLAFRDEIIKSHLELRSVVEEDEYLAFVQHLRAEEDRWKEVR